MTKKRIIISVLIAILLVAGVAVNIIAVKQKQDIEERQKNSTNIAENVDSKENKKASNENGNTIANTIISNDESASQEDLDSLELSGQAYEIADVTDKDGKIVTLEREENKPMIILFWNNTEELGIDSLKTLQNLYSKYNKKIEFTAISVVEETDVEEAEKILSDNKIEFKNYYDTLDLSASKANNVSQVPTLVVINKKGEIINTVSNELNSDVIEANLDIIAENF